MAVRSIAATLLLATSAFAKTDLAGCTYTDTVVKPSSGPAFASRIYYVPGTGELCDLLDCGGGRAPPRTDVPGCLLYSGAATYSPSFISLPSTAGDAIAAAATTPSPAIASASATGPASEGTAQGTALHAATASLTTLVATATSSAAATSTAASGVNGTVTGTSNGNGTAGSTGLKTLTTVNGAVPTAGAILGSCLMAGVAACVGML